MPKEDIPGAIDQFRVYYHDVGWLENEPYPGVREMLDTLQKTAFGCLWQPRSSRAWPCRCWGISAWRRILKRSAARRAIIRKQEKGECNPRGAAKAGCTDLTQAMILGDRKHDIIGGRLAGIRTAGILYGYGSREELAQAGADLICRTPEEFTKIMLSEQQEDKRMNATERKIAEDLLSIRAVFSGRTSRLPGPAASRAQSTATIA